MKPGTIKMKRGNSLVEVGTKKHIKNLLKMQTFHNLKCKAFSHD